MDNTSPELLGPLDEFARNAASEATAAGARAKLEDRLSALDLLTDRLPSDERDLLIRLVKEAQWTDNDPILIFRTIGQFRLDAEVKELRAATGDAQLRILQAIEELRGDEVGLSKYREHLQQLTDDTKAAIVEAAAYLNVLVKTEETGSTVLDAKLKAAMAKVAWRTAACMVGGDLLIRLLLTVFH